MRFTVSGLTSLLIIWLLAADPVSGVYLADRQASNELPPPTRLIVKYRSQVDLQAERRTIAELSAYAEIQELRQRYRITREHRLLPESAFRAPTGGLSEVYLLTVELGTDLEAAARDFEQSDLVEYAVPDYPVEFYDLPDDSLYAHQWALHNTGQGTYRVYRLTGNENDTLGLSFGVPDADIDFSEVFENPPDQTSTVVVAIVDTGVDWDHPDLVDHMWQNPGEVPDNGIDDDHNGYIDDVVGWDLASDIGGGLPGFEDNDPTDEYGHGTHCSGIITAITNNGFGVAGAAPDARIMALKFYPFASISMAVEAIVYAADNGADVINMSWGRGFPLPIVKDALVYARARGVICIASAGNDGEEAQNYPASYPQSMAIGASDDQDHVAYFSTYGEQIDLCAPGLSILSLRAEGSDMYGKGQEHEVHIIDSLYYLASGTSMSGPYAVAAAAYLRAVSPGLNHEVVESILETTADDIVDPYGYGESFPGWDMFSGHGRLNLAAALAAVPQARVVFDSPVRNAVISGNVDITGTADGADFVEYTLEVGPGTVPETWTQIEQSYSPVSNGLLGTWNAVGAEGVYTLRLRLSGTNMIVRTVYVTGSALAEITFPTESGTVSGEIRVIGTAVCPDYEYATLQWGVGASPTDWQTAADITALVYKGGLGVISGTYSPDGVYAVKLNVYSSTGLEASDTVVFTIASVFSGANGWTYDVAERMTLTANYADLDADGENEILVGTEDRMVVLNLDGSEKTTGIPSFPADDYRVVPAVGNLDGDGRDDIVVVAGSGVLYGYPSQAPPFQVTLQQLPETYRYPGAIPSFSKVFLNDIDGDGLDEIHYVVGEGVGCYIYGPDGSRPDCGSFTRFPYSRYLPADLDGDGLDEIYCAGGAGVLCEMDQCGNIITSTTLQQGGLPMGLLYLDMSAVDIDGDGVSELIIKGAYDEGSSQTNFWMYAFDEGLTLVSGWPHDTEIDGFLNPNQPVFADLDNDQQLEYIITYFEFTNSYVNAWRIDGTPLLGDTSSGGYFAACADPGMFNPPVISDGDGDGAPDILIGCGPDLFGAFLSERIYGFNRTAGLLPGYPLSVVNEVRFSSGNIPVVGDIDKDGYLDMVYVSDVGQRVCFANFPSVPYRADLASCPMWRYNRRLNATYVKPLPWVCQGMTGNVDCDPGDVVDVSDIQTLIDNQFLTLEPLCCFEEADMDLSGEVDITDLQLLIDNQFISLKPLPDCP